MRRAQGETRHRRQAALENVIEVIQQRTPPGTTLSYCRMRRRIFHQAKALAEIGGTRLVEVESNISLTVPVARRLMDGGLDGVVGLWTSNDSRSICLSVTPLRCHAQRNENDVKQGDSSHPWVAPAS